MSTEGASEGAPGVGLRVAGTGYPADCDTVYIFFDGTRIGTAKPDSAGTLTANSLRVPGEAKPGPHRVTSSCNSSGNPVVQASTFQVTDSDNHRVALVTALPRPDDVDFSAAALLASAAVVASMLFLIAFPGELFNTTLETHYDEVRGWFGLGPKRPEDRSGRSQFLPFAAFLLVGGILVSLLNPAFTVDRSGLGAALGLTIAIGIITLAYDIPSLAWVRRNYGDWGRLVILPGTILIGVACVILSRVVHFLPGYFYGLIAGLAFRRQIADAVKGRLTALSVVVVLALSVTSWLAMAPVSAAADKPGASLSLLILEAMLGGIFWCGLDSLVIGMLPLRFLGGSDVRAWSKAGWVVLFVLTQMAFVHILLRPSTGYVADTTHSPTAIVIFLFVLFALFSIAFWAYFRFRSPRTTEADQPNLVEVA
ncbi:MAG TPA: FGLLP motif-containing membrane protein [Acidimicrobiales bacterium]|nr:FGLLP motif-containing membrane protein [Acidimicrobiales bacterium]